MHLLKNSWQFSFKITEKLCAFHLKSLNSHAKRITYVRLILVYSAFLWPVLKIVLGIVLSNSFKLPLY